jgi:hypothetical protein
MRLFSGLWGELRVFADEALPSSALGIAEVPARFGARFRPALWRSPVHSRQGWRPDAPYVAVWPDGVAVPDLTEDAAEQEDDLAGLVLAELMHHTCFACEARFDVIYAEVGVPVLGCNLAWHRSTNVSGCPACGSDGGKSRIYGLALSPSL